MVLDSELDPNVREDLFLYFGTFTRGFLTVFELTLGNWVPVTRILHEEVSEWLGIVMILYRTFVGEAVVRVITAIFVLETFRAVQSNDEIMIMQKERQMKSYIDKMSMLFYEADESGDGRLTID